MDGKSESNRIPTEQVVSSKKRKQVKINKLRYAEYYGMQSILDSLYLKSQNGENFDKLMGIITSKENIVMAYRAIKRNKGSNTPGTDHKTIRDIEKCDIEVVVNKVRNILKAYNPRLVRRKDIPKPNGKTRPLGIPCIWDRLIQQCILQVLEPICEAKFCDRSFGFRPLRSADNAMADLTRYIQRSHLYYMIEIDIKGFFDNVNHTVLMRQIWNLGIRDKQLLCIIKKILKAKILMPSGNIVEPDKGTPQGGIISPLLGNIALNEFDWHMESQWGNHPLTRKWKGGTAKNGTPSLGSAFREMRKTKLKELHIIRYADDVRIVCSNLKDANKVMYGAIEWLEKRLKLEVSREKTRVVNLKKQRGEFLGFSIKAVRKSHKYVVKSNMCDKAVERTVKNVVEQIKLIQRAGHPDRIRTEISNFNSLVRGVHNYYRIATHITEDVQEIHHRTFRMIFNRLHPKIGRIEKKSRDYKQYGKAQRVPIYNGMTLLPIYYCSHQKPLGRKKSVNIYTEEGRAFRHEKLYFPNISIMNDIVNNPVKGKTIEYNDNRVSLFAGQRGKCGVTGFEFLGIDEIHCHHKIPKSLGGKDNYGNMILVYPEVHRLIHAKKKETISKYITNLNLNKTQLIKLNALREKVGNSTIEN